MFINKLIIRLQNCLQNILVLVFFWMETSGLKVINVKFSVLFFKKFLLQLPFGLRGC